MKDKVTVLVCLFVFAVISVPSSPGSTANIGERSTPGLLTLDQDLALTREYEWLVTSRVSTMEKELNQAATAGYRAASATLRGQQFAVLMQRIADPSETVRYRVLNEGKISSFTKKLREGAAQGFRYVPGTLTQSEPGRGDIRAVLEQDPASDQRYEYFVGEGKHKEEFSWEFQQGEEWHELDGETVTTLVRQTLEGGFAPVGLLTRTKESSAGFMRISLSDFVEVEHVLIGEKPVGPSAEAHGAIPARLDDYAILGGTPGPDLQASLNEAAAGGYRLALVASTGVLAPPSLIMRKDPESEGMFQYLVVGGMDDRILRFQLNEAAAHGFRVHPQAVVKSRVPWVITERAPGAERRYVYSVHHVIEGGAHLGSLEQGWHPSGMSHHLGTIVVEKESGKPLVASFGEFLQDPAAEEPDRDVLRIGTERATTFREEIAAAAAQGYRVPESTVFPVYYKASETRLTLDMVRAEDSSDPCEYFVINEGNESDMQEKLAEAVNSGFRIVHGAAQGTVGMWGEETVVVMTKTPGDPPPLPEYFVIGSKDPDGFDREVDEALADGWTLIGWGTLAILAR